MADQYTLRLRIARVRESHEPNMSTRDVDLALMREGYPSRGERLGTWVRLMSEGRGGSVITQHVIDTLVNVFGCHRSDLIPDHQYDQLDLCRNSACDHGQMAR